MVNTNYRQAFKSAIARIYHANGTIVGAGFLVADGQLLTCAHVVTAALGIDMTMAEAPETLLEVDFPLIAPGQKVGARVNFWRSVQGQAVTVLAEGEDIAGLRLEGVAPQECEALRLVVADELWGHRFRIFGFPNKRDEGIWAAGVIRDRLANGWVQIEDIKAQGQAVQPGFSGAPIWDEALEGVVGMAVAADKKRDETKTAFMIPTAMLVLAWAELKPLIHFSKAVKPEVIVQPMGGKPRNSDDGQPTPENQAVKDFFISYSRADKKWAEWIAWGLEEAGYSVVIQAWDFRPGGNFILEMQRATEKSQKTIAVLSESYFKSKFTQFEWAGAVIKDPQSIERRLLPIRVEECKPIGILSTIIYVDLVGLNEQKARQKLLEALENRVKPVHPPDFPRGNFSEYIETGNRIFPTPKQFPSSSIPGQEFKKILVKKKSSIPSPQDQYNRKITLIRVLISTIFIIATVMMFWTLLRHLFSVPSIAPSPLPSPTRAVPPSITPSPLPSPIRAVPPSITPSPLPDQVLPAEDSFNQGRSLFKLKDFSRAEKKFTDSLNKENSYLPPRVWRGITYIKLSKCDDAISDFKWAVKINSSNPVAYAYLGYLEAVYQGKIQDAQINFSKSMRRIDDIDSAAYREVEDIKSLVEYEDQRNGIPKPCEIVSERTLSAEGFLKSKLLEKLPY